MALASAVLLGVYDVAKIFRIRIGRLLMILFSR